MTYDLMQQIENKYMYMYIVNMYCSLEIRNIIHRKFSHINYLLINYYD